MIMNEITDLLGKRGPSGGMVTPRSCAYCGMFGHTREFCEEYKHNVHAAVRREMRQDTEWLQAQWTGKADLEWNAFIEWCDRRYGAAIDSGLTWENTLEEWRVFQKSWELEHPKPPCRENPPWDGPTGIEHLGEITPRHDTDS